MSNQFELSRRWFLKKIGVASGIAGAGLGIIQAGCDSAGTAGSASGGTGNSDYVEGLETDAGGANADGSSGGVVTTDASQEVDASQVEDQDTGDQEVQDAASTADAGSSEEDASLNDTSTEIGDIEDEVDAVQEGDTIVEPDVETGIDTGIVEGDGGEVIETCEITGSDVLGPFYEEGAPFTNQLADAEEVGVRIRIEGTVFEPDCVTPVSGALLDIWQADNDGEYHSGEEYRLRAQVLADEQGQYAFESILPGRYAMGGSFRPAHIHFTISKPGFVSVTTQMYFEGDPYLAPNDPCGGCNSGDLTQIVPMGPGEGNIEQAGTFDIVLSKN